MHIVFVCAEYPINDRPTGGFGSYVKRISQILTELNHRVTVICMGSKEKYIRQGLLNIYVVPDAFNEISYILSKSSFSLLNRLVGFISYPIGFSYSACKKILQLQDSQTFDIVEGGDFAGELFFTVLNHNKISAPLVIKLHTPSFIIRDINKEPLNLFYKFLGQIESYCLQRVDGIYSPSKSLAKIITKRTKRIIQAIIPYPGITLNNTKFIRRDPSSLLYVGKLQRKKGVFVLILAMEQVIKKFPEKKLHLVGPDTFERGKSVKEQLIYLIKNKGLSKHILFKPPLKYFQLTSFYQRAAVTIIPSLWENYPNVLIEAAMYGSPIVATDVGGISEMVDHEKDGLLVFPGDSHKLALAIMQSLQCPFEARKRNLRAQKHLRKLLNPKSIGKQTVDFYKKLKEKLKK